MRLRNRIVAIAALAMLVMSLFVSPAYAADTTNLAGRIISGDHKLEPGGTQCMGTMYGRVNGHPVLFTAAHCNWGGNMPVLARDGAVLGYWANNCNTFDINDGHPNCQGSYGNHPENYNGIASYDMSWIWLQPGYWPSNPQDIYRGAYAGGSWWHNLYKYGWDNFYPSYIENNLIGTPVYRNQQEFTNGVKVFASGNILGMDPDNNHYILTNLLTDNCTNNGIDSGTPWIVQGIPSILGVGAYAWGTPYCNPSGTPMKRYNVVANWEQSMGLLYNWVWNNYGTYTTYFCANTACN